jgi:pyruvate kinase
MPDRKHHAGQGKRLFRGDRFGCLPGRPDTPDGLPSITITFPDIVARLQPGLLVWIDDGKIGARVVEMVEDGAVLEVTVVPTRARS